MALACVTLSVMSPVWLREIQDVDEEGHLVLTGLFDGTLDEPGVLEERRDLPFGDALEWAQACTEVIYVDVEDERYSIGARTRSHHSAMPADVAARLGQGRRRPPGDAWIDRDQDSPPMRWEIAVTLSPDELERDRRAEQEGVVASVVRRLEVEGCRRVTWSADSLDAGLADIDAQCEAAGRPEAYGWVTRHSLAFGVSAVADAPTHRLLLERIRPAVLAEVQAATGRRPWQPGAEDLDGRWGVEVEVHPPGYEAPPLPV